ncbi:hypothetical protein BJX66DRAFT_77423 [Aspergillus keveii]|jgi:hypothetical protein|uniref:Beta/gamma crystallin 'Greek key' domain-containing protein n=1 Tax=Aspergillus keveii TaxID=714993 RepID=A0ABR4FNE8_9EURO
MKLSLLSLTTTLLLLASPGDAWRIRLYENINYKGRQVTYSGPGKTGSKCFSNVDPLNNKVTSIKYYAYNSDRSTRCCVTLYDSPGCKTKNQDWKPQRSCHDEAWKDIPGIWDNDISSFKTECRSV